MKIGIVGLGYVGCSIATLLGQNNKIIAYDIDFNKVELFNNKVSPIQDTLISEYLKNKELDITSTTLISDISIDLDFIIISTPTNFQEEDNSFDTSSIEDIIHKINTINKTNIVVIKSTIPIGFTQKLQEKYPELTILFSPEFLSEGSALYDCLNPDRIIVGGSLKESEMVAAVFKSSTTTKNAPIILMTSEEAEATKLFANSYLAMRVAFFNELDTFASQKKLSSSAIIEGISSDSRIGNFYNNPSFGYGGYCLPKDTKQLEQHYENIPQNIISAIVNSNETRKEFIAKEIIRKNPGTLGIYRLAMKYNSDNFRSSAIIDILNFVKKANIKLIIYEPSITEDEFLGIKVENDLEYFKSSSDIILANRFYSELNDSLGKIYCRDIFNYS